MNTKQVNTIHKHLIKNGFHKTMTLFGNNNQIIKNFLHNNNSFIYDYIDNLNVKYHETPFGNCFTLKHNDNPLATIDIDENIIHIKYPIWIFLKLLKYDEDLIKKELLTTLNNKFKSNITKIVLVNYK